MCQLFNWRKIMTISNIPRQGRYERAKANRKYVFSSCRRLDKLKPTLSLCAATPIYLCIVINTGFFLCFFKFLWMSIFPLRLLRNEYWLVYREIRVESWMKLYYLLFSSILYLLGTQFSFLLTNSQFSFKK